MEHRLYYYKFAEELSPSSVTRAYATIEINEQGVGIVDEGDRAYMELVKLLNGVRTSVVQPQDYPGRFAHLLPKVEVTTEPPAKEEEIKPLKGGKK